MPTEIKLQWHKSTKRWRKKIGGKDYYFIGGKGTCPSNLAGYREAWGEYQELARTLATKHPATPKVITKREQARFHAMTGNPTEAAIATVEASQLQARIESGHYQPEPDFITGGGYQFFADDRALWNDRINTLHAVEGAEAGKMLSATIRDFLLVKETQATNGKISAGRWDFLTRCLANCLVIVGDIPTKTISAPTMLRVYKAIITRNDWSPDYQQSNFTIWRQFVNWCWENSEIEDLPRNIRSADFTFEVSATNENAKQPKPKILFKNDMLAEILTSAPEKIQLWVLLCLNCGYTQKDMSDLKQTEVDWEAGRIRRKRSKTNKAEGTIEVEYKLWSRTFELLKKFRSKKGNRVLVTRNGTPYVKESIKLVNGVKKIDRKDIMARTFYLYMMKKFGKTIALKMLRKTGNSILNASDFRDLRYHYLGHSPRSVAEKSYDVEHPNFQPRFDRATDYLQTALGIA